MNVYQSKLHTYPQHQYPIKPSISSIFFQYLPYSTTFPPTPQTKRRDYYLLPTTKLSICAITYMNETQTQTQTREKQR